MYVEVVWSDEAIAHLKRSQRYPGAVDIDPAWVVEAAQDDGAVMVTPYWTSRVNATAIIGYAPTAGMVLLVLVYADLAGTLHGLTAWPATGRALRVYTDRNRP